MAWLLSHPRWNQSLQPHGFPGGGWSGVAVYCSQSLTVSGSLEIPSLEWHTENHAKASAGQCRLPAFLWSVFWSMWQSSVGLTSARPDDVCTCRAAITQGQIPRVPAGAGAGQWGAMPRVFPEPARKAHHSHEIISEAPHTDIRLQVKALSIGTPPQCLE